VLNLGRSLVLSQPLVTNWLAVWSQMQNQWWAGLNPQTIAKNPLRVEEYQPASFAQKRNSAV